MKNSQNPFSHILDIKHFFGYQDALKTIFNSLKLCTVTLIPLINVTSRLSILENSTLHKTKIPPARLLISLQNFQYSYRTFNILTRPNDDISHGYFEP